MPVWWGELSISFVAVESLNLSMPSALKGSAIPLPGVRIGNSSSSGNGMGCEMVLPRIEVPVFVRAGASARHFPVPRNLLMVKTDDRTGLFLLRSKSTDQSR